MKPLRLVPLLAALVVAVPADAQTLVRWPAVGAVTDSSAVVLLWFDRPANAAIEYSTDTLLAKSQTTATQASAADEDNTARIALPGLLPATRYFYRAVVVNGTGISPIQSFRTLPITGVDAAVTLLFGSCQQRTPDTRGRIFDVAAGLGGDLFVQMGDWTYPDERIGGYPAAAGSIRQSYLDRYDTTYAFARRVLSRTGFAYLWDDHDYSGNNGDGALPETLKQGLLDAYRFHVPHAPLESASGIWHSIRIGNVELFMIDSRSQRAPVDSAFTGGHFAPPPGHSMLAGYPIPGIDQRRWLLNAIRTSTARWKIIVSPVMFNPAAAQIITVAELLGREDVAREVAEKWVGYPEDIDSMRALFAEGYGRNLAVISGDAHVNVYDDGTHSLVPEFLAGNLDITTSHLFDTLAAYGLQLWTGMQSGSTNTVGRLRVQTTPRHRLILESYNESGQIELQLQMEDSSTTGIENALEPDGPVICEPGLHRILLHGLSDGPATVELYDALGELRSSGRFEMRDGTLAMPVPEGTPPGVYFGIARTGSRHVRFRFAWMDR